MNTRLYRRAKDFFVYILFSNKVYRVFMAPFDLKRELVTWFHEHGSTPCVLDVEVK